MFEFGQPIPFLFWSKFSSLALLRYDHWATGRPRPPSPPEDVVAMAQELMGLITVIVKPKARFLTFVADFLRDRDDVWCPPQGRCYSFVRAWHSRLVALWTAGRTLILPSSLNSRGS